MRRPTCTYKPPFTTQKGPPESPPPGAGRVTTPLPPPTSALTWHSLPSHLQKDMIGALVVFFAFKHDVSSTICVHNWIDVGFDAAHMRFGVATMLEASFIAERPWLLYCHLRPVSVRFALVDHAQDTEATAGLGVETGGRTWWPSREASGSRSTCSSRLWTTHTLS